MEEQALISREINAGLIGTEQEVLIEGKSDLEGATAIGRCRRQAPEIDGVTYVLNGNPEPGTIVLCRITAADEYDLYADML
jgi:ribosomal protein S12 methylthiotransferase